MEAAQVCSLKHKATDILLKSEPKSGVNSEYQHKQISTLLSYGKECSLAVMKS